MYNIYINIMYITYLAKTSCSQKKNPSPQRLIFPDTHSLHRFLRESPGGRILNLGKAILLQKSHFFTIFTHPKL